MAIPIEIDFASPDPALKFTTVTDLVQVLDALVTAQTAEDITPYIVGDSTPAVEDQDKVWHRLHETSGSPLGTYHYYNGIWVREEPPVGGRISWFAGDPNLFFDANGLGLRTISGTVAADYFGWQIANGNNGTANLSDLFIVGARMDNSGITGWDDVLNLWRTNIRGHAETVGGEATITTDVNTTYRSARDSLEVGKWDADQARDASGVLWGLRSGTDDSLNEEIYSGDAGNLTPLPIQVVNPFFAMAIIAWIGYGSPPY